MSEKSFKSTGLGNKNKRRIVKEEIASKEANELAEYYKNGGLATDFIEILSYLGLEEDSD